MDDDGSKADEKRQLELLQAKLAAATPRYCGCGQRLGLRQTGSNCFECQRRRKMRASRARRAAMKDRG